MMAQLIRRYDLRTTIDIGVYRGRSLFPQAVAHHRFTGGIVYGVDPWSASEARERDTPELKEDIDDWADATDFEALYRQVDALIASLGLSRHCELVRLTSEV